MANYETAESVWGFLGWGRARKSRVGGEIMRWLWSWMVMVMVMVIQ